MTEAARRAITELLRAWKQEGDVVARDELFVVIDRDLRDIARRLMGRRRPGAGAIQPTELVGELFIKLASYDVQWDNRHLFFGMVCRIVRNILLDMARHDHASKRPPSRLCVDTDLARVAEAPAAMYEIVALYQALDRLRVLNVRHAEVLEMHGLVGFTLDEVAQTLGVSRGTVTRDHRAALAWLRSELGGTRAH